MRLSRYMGLEWCGICFDLHFELVLDDAGMLRDYRCAEILIYPENDHALEIRLTQAQADNAWEMLFWHWHQAEEKFNTVVLADFVDQQYTPWG